MMVRIVEGPFAEFTGKIDFVNEEKEILKVTKFSFIVVFTFLRICF